MTLVAVTKTFDADAIEPVLAAGHRDFGENRVQEAQGKWPALQARDPDLRLHLIGPLQTNKVRDAVALFDAIHSVDRDKLAADARQGDGAAGTAGSRSSCRSIPARSRRRRASRRSEAAEFVRRCRDEHGLAIDGLMCIPPEADDPDAAFRDAAGLGGGGGSCRRSPWG